MIRGVFIDVDHREAPSRIEIHSIDDIYARIGGTDVETTIVRRLPDGYDLLALAHRDAKRRNVVVGDKQLCGPVVLVVYDDISQSYIQPSPAAEPFLLAQARLLVQYSELACQI